MNEIWKSVKGFEGIYAVSNFGRLKSFGNITGRKEKILKCTVTHYGYGQYSLNNNGYIELWKAHRLIAEHFLPKIEGKDCINHKDGNKLNNHVDNLEWCTRQENIIHSYDVLHRPHTKMKDGFIYPPKAKSVIQLDSNRNEIAIFSSMTKAGEALKINRSQIYNAIIKNHKTAGFYWKYA